MSTNFFPNYFEVFKSTDQFRDSVVDIYQDQRVDQISVVYVSKAGSDDFPGSHDQPKLTIGAALASGEGQFRVEVMDAGLYEEDIVIPTGVTVFGIGASLRGTATVTGGSQLYLERHLSSANGQTMVEMTADEVGQALYHVNVSDSREHTGVISVANVGGGGKNFFIEIGLMFVGEDGVGVTDRTSGAGHIHFNIKDLYLAGDNCIGIRSGQAGQNSTNIIGFIDHILEFGSPLTSTGILLTHSNARVNVIMGEIIAATAYEVTAGELYLICPRIVGTRTGTPEFELSQHTI